MVVAIGALVVFFLGVLVVMTPIYIAVALARWKLIDKAKISVGDEIDYREARLKKYDWIDANKINREIDDLRKTAEFLHATPRLIMLFSESFQSHYDKLTRYSKLSQDAHQEEGEKNTRIVDEREVAARHQAFLDQDNHDHPAQYSIGRHARETLAVRYGAVIGGDTIRLKKIRPAGMYDNTSRREDLIVGCFLVSLCELRDRRALAIIEKGTDYVKTFYPFEKQWFDINFDLERLCCTNFARDSSRESSAVGGLHEQNHIPDLQDQELASLQ